MITKWKYVLVITFVTLFQSEATNNTDSQKCEAPRKEVIDYRLPTTIIPTHYDLHLNFLQQLSFRGTVRIEAIVQKSTNKIVLNYSKLKIKETSILRGKNQVQLQSKDYNAETEKYTITLTNVLPKGTKISIIIVYSGEDQNDLKGLHNIPYFNKNGERQKMAATQFSPLFARRAFPCFDEPAFKAFFKIHIRRPANYVALSNMPLKSSKVIALNYDDLFEESVKMSTYLVGFVVGDLKSIGNNNIKIWTREEVQDQAKYALTIGASILKTLEFFFNDSYQISKLDMVALPKMYFSAMENWGLITFRESSLLYDQRDTSVAVQQTVTQVIAHECTHMWFGNLVTPDWWGYLWLKEAFAGYFEYKTLSVIEPTWGMKGQILHKQQNALLIDSLPSSQPLTRNVGSPSEVMGMFDGISYDKGLSILRMMNLSFGNEVFNSALLSYLQLRKYKTGKPEDLFASIQMKIDSNLPASVETIMNSWTRQSGYPVLSVTVIGDHVKLRQNQFSLKKKISLSSDKKWWIPITWFSKSSRTIDTTTDKWMNDDEVMTVDREEDDWIIFNALGAGFYRVNYDTLSWRRIIKALKGNNFTDISVLNRASIVDDLLNLARANLVDYNLALEGLQYLKQETNYLPFKSALQSLDYLTIRFSGQPEYNIYSKYVLRLIKNMHLKLGFTDNKDTLMTNMLLRRDLNMIACNLGQEDCVNKSLKYFNDWKNGKNARVSRNLKSVVYTTAMKKGTAEDWHFLWNKYNATNVVSEQTEILNALSCSPDFKILNQHLSSFLINSNNHRMYVNNLKDVISSILSCNLFGVEILIEFIDNNFEELLKYNGNNLQQISSILSEVSRYLSTRTLVDKFQSLIQSHYIDFEPIMTSLKLLIESAEFELAWYQRNSKKITNWLETDDLEHSEDLNYVLSD